MRKLLFLFLLFPALCFAQEYQKVKYVVVVRGTEYGEFTKSDWIDDKKLPDFFNLTGIDQKAIDTSLQSWKDAEAYAKAHPAPVVEPSKDDYLNMYNQAMTDAQRNLDLYSATASKAELQAIEADMLNKATALNSTIATKQAIIAE